MSNKNVTQMHRAKAGEVTPEMKRIAVLEKVEPEFIRQEVALGPRDHPRQREPFKTPPGPDGHRD